MVTSGQKQHRPGHSKARGARDKQLRRRAILAAAADLFSRRRYEDIPMDGIARACGLAKGTLYLYYGSKEELFLAMSIAELADWLDAVDLELDRHANAPALGAAIVSTLQERPKLLRLLVILHAVLEHKVRVASLREFKRALLQRLQVSGTKLENKLPFLPPGHGVRALLLSYALIVGLYQTAELRPDISRVLSVPDLAPLRLDFPRELAVALAALLLGLGSALPKNKPI